MHFRFQASVTLLLLFALREAAPAAPGRPFRFDELARAGRVGGFSLSPDGQSVVYTVGTSDVEENRTRSALWLQSLSGGEPRRLTSGEKRDSDPKFSPDGGKVAFLSNRDGGSQIYLLDLTGGEPAKASSFPADVNGFRWSPDGKWFVFTADVFPDCPDAACDEKKFKEREKSKTKARVAERLLFRHWDSWKDGLREHVWKAPVAGAASTAVDLTHGARVLSKPRRQGWRRQLSDLDQRRTARARSPAIDSRCRAAGRAGRTRALQAGLNPAAHSASTRTGVSRRYVLIDACAWPAQGASHPRIGSGSPKPRCPSEARGDPGRTTSRPRIGEPSPGQGV